MPPSDCFGTGREHKLDLLCGLFGVLDCKWMSGPAGSRDHQPRGTGAQTEIPAKSIARSHERAKESCAFLLTKTYMEAGHSPGTPESHSRRLLRASADLAILANRSGRGTNVMDLYLNRDRLCRPREAT